MKVIAFIYEMALFLACIKIGSGLIGSKQYYDALGAFLLMLACGIGAIALASLQ